VWLPGILALVAALLMLLPARNTRGFDMAAFNRLPVLQGGRVKPLDSVARNALLLIRGKQSIRFEGRNIEAREWMLDVLFRPHAADAQPIFVINDPDVLGLMGIQQSPDRYYSFSKLLPHLEEVENQARSAMELEAAQRTRFQRAVVDLYQRVILYHQLANSLQPSHSAGLTAELRTSKEPGADARQAELAQLAYFMPLPPLPGHDKDAWLTVGDGLAAYAKGMVHPSLELFAQAGAAYAAGDPQGFNTATAGLADLSASQQPSAVAQASHEYLFNQAKPFIAGIVIYLLSLLALFVSWAWKPEQLRLAAYSLLIAGLIVHSVGLVSRMVIQGRPPVTNLYSSAVFVGWVAVILGVVLERMYRRGFATAVAAAAGFASLIVAHHLSDQGDTMEMMRAVLDSNFWLATHVVTITIGYGGTFLAGTLAIGYALRRLMTSHPDEGTTKALVDTTYGILCFSLLFSFVGTVLGGIWADQSWGRFWGWDPKENGALLIVLWIALILHARWGGYAKERGLMAMAIVGNIITALAWFGVNLLNVGLHSYGFTDKGLMTLATFTVSQFLFMGVCLIPINDNKMAHSRRKK
jgi:ABC-type transport system involved in cytochrome c biogenesis permease subunit